MKYFTFQAQFQTHFVAIPDDDQDSIDVRFTGSEAIAISMSFTRPDSRYMKPITVAEFYNAFVSASTQLYAHFRIISGDVFPIDLNNLGTDDQPSTAP